MSFVTSSASVQSDAYSSSEDASGMNIDHVVPGANRFNGNTQPFFSSTYIHNYQCQHVYESYSNTYHGCTFYASTPTPNPRLQESPPLLKPHARPSRPTHGSARAAGNYENKYFLLPFYWPWVLLKSFVRVIVRAVAMSIGKRTSRNILRPNTQGDLEAQAGDTNTDNDRFSHSSVRAAKTDVNV
ncbi:hypothetical protein AAF712_011934 [Marasmius tenuissimus]|uniref:Uncharacterized protein n=1 Tax=Marasmius tenuissimus TaxID=585030 RepID=A0ABR2ZJQ8_9AGAR